MVDRPRSVDGTLLRVVVGWRLFSLLWMLGLSIEVLANDDAANGSVVVAALITAVVWSGITVAVARNRPLFQSFQWLAADGLVTVLIALAPMAADSESTFFGGYPLSWVIYVAYVAGRRWFSVGGIGAGVMSTTQVADEVIRQNSWNVVGDVAVFFATAWVMGAGMWALRRNEALRIRAEQELAAERAARLRADERAELAARLHDSVLQTLPVMRRRADDTSAVRQLSRRVERQLRQFLERLDSDYANGLRAAIRDAAWDVEDLYDISIEAVGVGDCAIDIGTQAMVAAAREAMINAAKHSGRDSVDVYTEVRDGTAHVFIRDRGPGFEREENPGPGRGIDDSIVGRMERHRGTAVIRTSPGEGTEVELSLPLAPD